MRIALISDIHGHHAALEAVLADIAGRSVEKTVCLGDTASIGPQPQRVLRTLKQAGCICVRGNHDEAMLDPGREVELKIPDRLIPTFQWSLKQLTNEDLAFMQSFEPTVTVALGGDTAMLCYHGSPQSVTDELVPTLSEKELAQFFAGRKEAVYAGGHTHQQMRRDVKGAIVLNPGSIGVVFKSARGAPTRLQQWAEYAIVDATAGAIQVELRKAFFDVKKAIDDIVHTDNPLKRWWLEQYQ